MLSRNLIHSRAGVFLFIVLFCFNFDGYAQITYTVQGTILDENTSQPVQDAQVWLYGTQVGDVTDSLGYYQFKVHQMHSETRMYVRYCGYDLATSKLVEFGKDSLVETNFTITTHQPKCPSPPNIPWKVDPSVSVPYIGYIFLDLHGIFFRSCNGNSYSPVWPSGTLEEDFWSANSQLGDSLFIEMKGRLDPYSKGVIPFQNLYVGEIVSVSKSRPKACN